MTTAEVGLLISSHLEADEVREPVAVLSCVEDFASYPQSVPTVSEAVHEPSSCMAVKLVCAFFRRSRGLAC